METNPLTDLISTSGINLLFAPSSHILGFLRITSMKFRQPSLGTKAVIFLPFLMSWTLTHFLMAELGCLASTPLQGKPTSKEISVEDH